MKALEAPDGFRVRVFAESLGHASMLAVAEDGAVFLTAPKQGKDYGRLADFTSQLLSVQ